jgi:hypothetical protein
VEKRREEGREETEEGGGIGRGGICEVRHEGTTKK